MRIIELHSVLISAKAINSAPSLNFDELIAWRDRLEDKWWDICSHTSDTEAIAAMEDYKKYSAAEWRMLLSPRQAKHGQSYYSHGLLDTFSPSILTYSSLKSKYYKMEYDYMEPATL